MAGAEARVIKAAGKKKAEIKKVEEANNDLLHSFHFAVFSITESAISK